VALSEQELQATLPAIATSGNDKVEDMQVDDESIENGGSGAQVSP
jgi:hypothetical protein